MNEKSSSERCWTLIRRFFSQNKVLGLGLVVVAIVGVLGVPFVMKTTSSTYQHEEYLPELNSRNTRVFLSDLEDANITVTFTNEPDLWFRMSVTQYTSRVRHRIETYTDSSSSTLTMELTSVIRIKSINLELGTDVVHSIQISGENLNTLVVVDNGAKISESFFHYYSTGILQFIMTENVNFTTRGMKVETGWAFYPYISYSWPQEQVILDINLPTGLNGNLFAPNTTFIENDWIYHGQNQWSTASINEPLLDIAIFDSKRVWARLQA